MTETKKDTFPMKDTPKNPLESPMTTDPPPCPPVADIWRSKVEDLPGDED